jgi:hypothetical protein
VASNPVAGHSVGTQNLYTNVVVASSALGAIYVAEDSYGNTDRKNYTGTSRIQISAG